MTAQFRRQCSIALLGGCAALLATFCLACGDKLGGVPAPQVAGGHASDGKRAMQTYGCGGCHVIPGVDGASGNVGPPLTGMGSRRTIAGLLPNEPASLIRWIQYPQDVLPGNVMPNMSVSDQDARDIAAYIYTLR